MRTLSQKNSDLKKIENIKDIELEDKRNIINWFIIVSFRGYYSSSTDTKLDSDIESIKKSEKFPYSELINKIQEKIGKTKIKEKEILDAENKNIFQSEGKIYLFLLYLLLAKNDASDWNSKLIKKCKYSELAKHHIFPKDYLEDYLEYDDPSLKDLSINNLGNVTFINAEVNSQIGDSAPSDYLPQYKGNLSSHLIPIEKGENYSIANFGDFKQCRVKNIYDRLKELFPQIVE
jgi:hypothetical protein